MYRCNNSGRQRVKGCQLFRSWSQAALVGQCCNHGVVSVSDTVCVLSTVRRHSLVIKSGKKSLNVAVVKGDSVLIECGSAGNTGHWIKWSKGNFARLKATPRLQVCILGFFDQFFLVCLMTV